MERKRALPPEGETTNAFSEELPRSSQTSPGGDENCSWVRTQDFLRSLHVALRRPETMKIGSECSATCRGCAASHPVFCLSNATSAGCATFSEEVMETKHYNNDGTPRYTNRLI